MSDETAIKVEHVSKNFILPHEKITTVKGLFTSALRRRKKTKEVQHALRDVSFEIKKGEFFGIVGRNGSGKSTMLKMLAGIYQPTHGKIRVHGKLVPFIELGVGFNPELTGRENVYLNGAMMGFSQKETDAMYEDIVAFAELEEFMDQKLKNYSSGMQVRLAFSVAIRAEADVLLVDEVLAVGDADFQRKCYEYFKTLKRNKKTVVFVSHDMGAIREFCTKALLIEESRVIASGKASYVASKYSQLFIEDSPEKELKEIAAPQEKESSRWGNGKVKFANVSAVLAGDKVVVTSDVKAAQMAESVIYGLHITAQDGTEITAMNNRMILQPDIDIVAKSDVIQLAWSVLNVFNDGRYYVTLTLVNDAGVTYDWFVDAASFNVRRTERSTTAVLPPVTVTYKIKDGAKA